MKTLAFMIITAIGCIPVSAASFSFRADLTPDAVVPGSPADDPAGVSTASGSINLILTTEGVDGPTLSYNLLLSGLAVSETIPRPTLDGPDNLVRAIHIHFGAPGTNGGHALNVYGAPREDDADLIVNSAVSQVSGLWDDGDENLGPDGTLGSGDSVALSDALADLHAGNLYIQVHTMGFRAGELRGQVLAVPEPSTAILSALGLLLCRRRRRP